jgi:hypothetical protein
VKTHRFAIPLVALALAGTGGAAYGIAAATGSDPATTPTPGQGITPGQDIATGEPHPPGTVVRGGPAEDWQSGPIDLATPGTVVRGGPAEDWQSGPIDLVADPSTSPDSLGLVHPGAEPPASPDPLA